jgi:hypothetical protein
MPALSTSRKSPSVTTVIGNVRMNAIGRHEAIDDAEQERGDGQLALPT